MASTDTARKEHILKQTIEDIMERVLDFRDQRDWGQFHTVKNLAQALIVEAAELNEIVQWKEESEIQDKLIKPDFKKKISDECADVFIYLLLISNRIGIDLLEAAESKIRENAAKYPVERAKGSANKYTDL
jgi:NTP pyrophosphatase (non-canonical NTP hydrolase)